MPVKEWHQNVCIQFNFDYNYQTRVHYKKYGLLRFLYYKF